MWREREISRYVMFVGKSTLDGCITVAKIVGEFVSSWRRLSACRNVWNCSANSRKE